MNAFNPPENHYIRTAPRVSADMLSADFWLKDMVNPQKPLLSLPEINTKNHQIHRQLNLHFKTPKPPLAYGICCKESAMLYNPIQTPSFSDEDPYSDENQFSGILAGEPVEILKSVSQGNWLYIRTYYGFGWVSADVIALCRNPGDWRKLPDNSTDFLVVTGKRLTLPMERTNPQKQPESYGMGTVLPLVPVDRAPEILDQRQYFDNYVIQIPTKDPCGFLKWDYKLIPISEDVHPGYLTYTTENVLKQIFKLQGDLYGWGDMYQSHDCSSLAMAVYRCFGFRLARNSWEQAAMPFPQKDFRQLTDQKKQILLADTLPGSLLAFDGHIVLYLGHVDHHFYGINATGNCRFEENGSHLSTAAIFICELGSTYRKNGRSWLSEFHTLLKLI